MLDGERENKKKRKPVECIPNGHRIESRISTFLKKQKNRRSGEAASPRSPGPLALSSSKASSRTRKPIT